MQLDDAQTIEKIFGGKTMVLSGDFRQSYLLFPREDEKTCIVSALLPRLHLWQHVTILRLHINMRVMVVNSKEQREFAKWVLNVGDGSLITIAKEEGVNLDWIKILSHMRLPTKNYNLRKLIQTIYPDHQRHFKNAMYLMQCNILTPKSTNVDEVKNAILESLSEELHTYLSTNSLASIEEGVSAVVGISMDSLYSVEFLNTL
jgi:hypothetical protein